MKYIIEYLGFKGEVIETIEYKGKKSFAKEISDSNEIGRPIQFKQFEEELEKE